MVRMQSMVALITASSGSSIVVLDEFEAGPSSIIEGLNNVIEPQTQPPGEALLERLRDGDF